MTQKKHKIQPTVPTKYCGTESMPEPPKFRAILVDSLWAWMQCSPNCDRNGGTVNHDSSKPLELKQKGEKNG